MGEGVIISQCVRGPHPRTLGLRARARALRPGRRRSSSTDGAEAFVRTDVCAGGQCHEDAGILPRRSEDAEPNGPASRFVHYLIATITKSTDFPPMFLASCAVPRPMNTASPRAQVVFAGLPSIDNDTCAAPSAMTT